MWKQELELTLAMCSPAAEISLMLREGKGVSVQAGPLPPACVQVVRAARSGRGGLIAPEGAS